MMQSAAGENGPGWFGAKRWTILALFFWLALNLCQVAFTGLTSDEGYYWFYAQHLQWGYYDHPPLVALLIKAGGAIFSGTLGVRFFNVVLSTASLALFFSLLPIAVKKSNSFLLVLLSAPLLHYLCFFVFPDGPLLFFSLIFLVAYKKYLARPGAASALLLGIGLAGMAYAKYHGALVLLFTVLANPKLLRQRWFYVSLGVAAVLFAPHLWWQYQHNFPTLRYHLFGRTSSYSFRFVGEYLSQQVVALGPGLLFVPFVVKTNNPFERALKFIFIGSLLFFLISSAKTFVHFHWTSTGLFPLLYFSSVYYSQPENKRLFRILVLPFVGLLFAARFLLVVPIFPSMHVGEDFYHGRKSWANTLATIAGDRYVFMPNNLREAPLYTFYTGKKAVALYTRTEKKSQYEMWGYEDSLQGKEVLYVNNEPFIKSTPIPTPLGKPVYTAVLPRFSSYYNSVGLETRNLVQIRDSVKTRLVITNQRQTPLLFDNGLNGETTTLVYLLQQGNKVINTGILQHLNTVHDRVLPSDSLQVEVSLSLQQLPAGRYLLFFGIRNGILPDAVLTKGLQITR